MHVFIQTLGSRGDVQPFIALGQGLLQAGHDVTLCTSSSFEPFVTGHGLRYAYLNNDLVEIMHSALGRDLMEAGSTLWGAFKATWQAKQQLAPINRRMVDESWQAVCEAKPDLIFYHPKAFACPDFAEKLGIPAVMALLQPALAPTRAFPCFGFPRWPFGGWYHRLTYRLMLAFMDWGTRTYIQEWRQRTGLAHKRRPGVLQTMDGAPIPVLHGISPQVVARPPDWPPSAHLTGYWFLDDAKGWKPPADLAAFLSAGEPPVYVGFGSMAGRRTAERTRLVIEALQAAGVRGIIATGWGGLSPDNLPATILQVETVPHAWLFPRLAAAVHHGGAGTTAASLRAGCPTIVCPFIADQPFWGQRVRELGAGVEPIPQKKLTADRLAQAIRQAISDPAIRRNAAEIGQAIRREDGIAHAIDQLAACAAAT